MKVTLGNEKKNLDTFKASDLESKEAVLARAVRNVPLRYSGHTFIVGRCTIVGFDVDGRMDSWDNTFENLDFEFVRLDTSLTLEND